LGDNGKVVRRGAGRSLVIPTRIDAFVDRGGGRRSGGAVNLKKVVTFILVAFTIFYVIAFPSEASALVTSAVNGLGNIANSLGQFVRDLVA